MISVQEYRAKLLEEEGFIDEEKVLEHAKKRMAWKGATHPVPRFFHGVSRAHCRLGDRECPDYKGCCDECRVVKEKITSLDECPKALDN